jgi:hypothetical protein
MLPIALPPERTATTAAVAGSFRNFNPVAGVLGHWHSHGWPRRGGELTWLTETHAAPAGTQEQPYGQSQRAAETSSTLLMIRQAGNLASAHLGMLAHWVGHVWQLAGPRVPDARSCRYAGIASAT